MRGTFLFSRYQKVTKNDRCKEVNPLKYLLPTLLPPLPTLLPLLPTNFVKNWFNQYFFIESYNLKLLSAYLNCEGSFIFFLMFSDFACTTHDEHPGMTTSRISSIE